MRTNPQSRCRSASGRRYVLLWSLGIELRALTRFQIDRASSKVLAAIADDAAASIVLSMAAAIANLYAATVQAVHVGEQEHARLTAAAQDAGVSLRTVAGQPVEALAWRLRGKTSPRW